MAFVRVPSANRCMQGVDKTGTVCVPKTKGISMADVFDVAAYILSKHGKMSTWKLQKLVYYCQAWHAVWDDEPLFEERIEAWANGPVCPTLYQKHAGNFIISSMPNGDPEKLSASQKDSIRIVLKHYGKYNGQQLSDLAHAEKPWTNARRGLGASERGNVEITVEAMTEYYGGL
jgi:uncharacterized phage-associated protein